MALLGEDLTWFYNLCEEYKTDPSYKESSGEIIELSPGDSFTSITYNFYDGSSCHLTVFSEDWYKEGVIVHFSGYTGECISGKFRIIKDY